MSFQIEPWHIALAVAVIGGGAYWFYRQKNVKTDKEDRKILDELRNQKGKNDPLKGEVDPDQEKLKDKLAADEEEAPMLSAADQIMPEVKASAAAESESAQAPEEKPAPREPEQKELNFSQTSVEVPRYVRPAGHRLAEIDEGVEAVAHFTPEAGEYFTPEAIAMCEAAVRDTEMPFPLNLSFFNADTGFWSASLPAGCRTCSQIYLSVQTADSVKGLDSMSASRFISLAERLAIDLPAEAEVPDGETILAKSEKVRRIVERFSQYLTFKLVGCRDIDDSALNQAAVACGFSYTEGHYEKREGTQTEPLIVLGRMPEFKNELGLALNIALSVPASDPLAQIFSVANDLAARLDLELTDQLGAPMGSRAAAGVARQLAERYREMQAAGAAAGSARARRIFSVV